MPQRQLHLWVTDGEYFLLRDLAADRQETVSALVRRLLRVYRLMYPDPRRATPAVPPAPVETGPRVFG